MKITTADEMREIDRITTARFGVQSITLMENAGSAVAQFILERYRHANRIAVICGTPTPATTRVVQMLPGPMPTLIASAPASIKA